MQENDIERKKDFWARFGTVWGSNFEQYHIFSNSKNIFYDFSVVKRGILA